MTERKMLDEQRGFMQWWMAQGEPSDALRFAAWNGWLARSRIVWFDAAPADRGADVTSYVHVVPDHCDRIAWRGRYYHLDSIARAQSGPQQKAVGTQTGQTDIVELIARLESHKCHISDEEYGWDFDAGRLAIKALRCLMDGTPSSQEDHAAGPASPAAPPKADEQDASTRKDEGRVSVDSAVADGIESGIISASAPVSSAPPPQSRESETDTLRGTDAEKPPFIRLGNAYFLCEQLELRLSALARERDALRRALEVSAERWSDMAEIIREQGKFDNAGFCAASGRRCREALSSPGGGA